MNPTLTSTQRPSLRPEAFAQLGLRGAVLRGVAAAGYETPTPIQEQAVPHALDGRDVVGCAQTGTGKTAAFLLPILQGLVEDLHGSAAGRGRSSSDRGCGSPLALVVTPTRELAAQIESVGCTLAGTGPAAPRLLAVYGGVTYGPQARRARRGVDLLIATPGRLLDMMHQGDISLASVSTLVLDEADRMLDMGFWPDIKRISDAVPSGRQSLFFSATMSRDVLSAIRSTLHDPVFLEVGASATPVENVSQSVLPVAQEEKIDRLLEYFRHHDPPCTLVFTRTRRRADRLARTLGREGVPCAAIHGDRSQAQRAKALDGFRRRSIRVLVATDVVARGIDVDGITHVINFDVPVSPEDYVHRIGRTARAGCSGHAVTLATSEDVAEVKAIERLIGGRIERRDVRGGARHDGVAVAAPLRKAGGGRATPVAPQRHAAPSDPSASAARRERPSPLSPRGHRRDFSAHNGISKQKQNRVRNGEPHGTGHGEAAGYLGETRRHGAAAGSSKRQGVGMAQGTVKWFNGQKGYGFIAIEGEKDVFVHINDLAPGVGTLNENQAVEFDVQEGRKGPQAVNVRPV